MTARIHVNNALGRIPPKIESQIIAGANEGILRLSDHIDVENVDVSIIPNDYVHEKTGVGGIAYGPESCVIFVDPNNRFLSENTGSNVPAVVVHELHHALRMRTFDYTGTNCWCGGSITALEGLATQAETFLGYGRPVNVAETTATQISSFLKQLKPIAYDRKADFNWIYRLNGLPWYIYRAVYPMGYHLVGAYLEKTRQNPIEAIGDPWEEIWETGMRELGI